VTAGLPEAVKNILCNLHVRPHRAASCTKVEETGETGGLGKPNCRQTPREGVFAAECLYAAKTLDRIKGTKAQQEVLSIAIG
jgi:hypothetical protein